MKGEQFNQSWGQLEGHLKKHWERLTNEDCALINGDLDRFNGVIEQRYGAISRDISQAADRWYAKRAGLYEGYKEAQTQ